MPHSTQPSALWLATRALPILSASFLAAAACSSASPAGSGGAAGDDDGGSGSGGASGGGLSTGSSTSSSSGGGDDATTGSSSGSPTSSGGTATSSGSGGTVSSSGGSGSGGSSGAGSSGSSGGGSSSGATGSSSGAAVSSCTKASAVCQASNTGCNVGSYYLYDNQWNCGGSTGNDCGPESAYGCTNSDGTVDFVVTSDQAAGNTAVLAYPAMQDNFNNSGPAPALSSFHTISATFEESSPHVGDYEVAWDCWFNDNANEFMVWVDDYNQVPAGSKVGSNVSLGGRTWDIWWSPGSGTSGYVVFYANTTVTSGTVDLLGLFNYAVAHSWLPASSTVDQLSFGIEVCSTGGHAATWTVSNYSITTN